MTFSLQTRHFSSIGITALLAMLALTGSLAAQTGFQAVPELGYSVEANKFELPQGRNYGEVSAVAVNQQGHLFIFQRIEPMLTEYDASGRYLRQIGEGLFTRPHGLRIDPAGNIWTTDVGSHVVLKLSPAGRVLLVLGHKDQGAEGDWVFNRPADVGFDDAGNIYVADGYGNSRVVKFDATGKFLTSWGHWGTGAGEFRLTHAVVVDHAGRVYVGDRENARIQVFDTNGTFLEQFSAGVGNPFGLVLEPNGHLLVTDGGYDRIVELDSHGAVLGSFGEPGHAPGQFAWPHSLALAANGTLYVADTLNWRVQTLHPHPASGKLSPYVPSVRPFNDTKPSVGWTSQPKSK